MTVDLLYNNLHILQLFHVRNGEHECVYFYAPVDY